MLWARCMCCMYPGDNNVGALVCVTTYSGFPMGLPPLCAACVPSGLLPKLNHKPWMFCQTQEKGSYRTEDMLDFLEWSLPTAACPQESIVVLLDWFAPHLSAEVASLVARKGHILLHHGGGVTGFEQINAAWPDVCTKIFLPYTTAPRLCVWFTRFRMFRAI